MNMCLLLNVGRERAAEIHQYANTVNGSKKEKLITFNFMLILI